MENLKTHLILLAMLVVLAGIAVLLSLVPIPIAGIPESAAQPLGEKIREGTAPIPVLTTSTSEKLAKSHGFQALVSYTDQGFEPATTVIKAGETVRFTNNSSHDVWIAADGAEVHIYPRTEDVCSSSDLDSCSPFSPQDFWEFTFDVRGEWHVVNNLDKTKGGIVRVR